MNLAVQKTITLAVLILIGVLLKIKIKEKAQINGIKTIILSIALPATIFVALLKINIEPALLFIPLLALAFNFGSFLSSKVMLQWMGFSKTSPTYRTMLMLIPSLAPGLSCFPFIIEFLNDDALAHAALADVGNKVFVLIILYILAMRWFYQNQKGENPEAATQNSREKLKSLLLALVKEPVNIVIISALILLSFGLNIDSLPAFISQSALKISAMMTPLVLIFIGIAVKVQWDQIKMIFTLLMWRSALAFFVSALLLFFLPVTSREMMLLIVIFPQSACSFWPFAHMSAVNQMEKTNISKTKRTFHIDLGLAMLACSLPFSTILILAICTFGDFFSSATHVGITGVAALAVAILPLLVNWLKKPSSVVSDLKHVHQETH